MYSIFNTLTEYTYFYISKYIKGRGGGAHLIFELFLNSLNVS